MRYSVAEMERFELSNSFPSYTISNRKRNAL
nr:MAG TPA: hypothetical protein [Caudoviricetes sp.]DAQ53981.1 MAG TPA: hypothetical protein [Caudoviricetes sp.]